MNYPLLDTFLTMLWFFLWVLWLFLLFRVVLDIFRDDKLSGVAKAGWLIFVIVLPYLGVLVYLIARGGKMGTRDVEAARKHQDAVDDYIRKTAAGSGTGGAGATAGSVSRVDELAKLSELRDKGALNDEEFAMAKAKFLA